MATYEHDSLMEIKDENGDKHIIYPITKAQNVDGLDEAINAGAGEVGDELSKLLTEHNAASDAHAALFKAITDAVAKHLKDTGNPHKVTPEQIGAIALSMLGQPNGPAVLDKDGRLTSEQLGGMIGGESDCGVGELQDTEMEVGTIINAGEGWNTYKFRESFDGVPRVICQVEDYEGFVQVKSVTEDGFLYCLRHFISGNTVTTGTAEKLHYIAIEYGGER